MSSEIALVIHIRGSSLLPKTHEPKSFISCSFSNLIGIICFKSRPRETEENSRNLIQR